MLKVKKSPGEWSAATGSALIPSLYQSSRKAAAATTLNSYVHRRESQGVSAWEGSFHQGPGFIIIPALVGFVLFHFCHVLGPCVTFTC